METTGHGRVVLVTGANRGIGFEVARQLGARGFTVALGARDAERGRRAEERLRAEGCDARAIRLDVTDAATIAVAVGWVGTEFGRLDVLVNNAGILADASPPSGTGVDTFRATFETNLFGVVALTNAALPLLRRSPAPRVVNVSSDLGSLALSRDWETLVGAVNYPAYQASKSALNAVTVSYAKELRQAGIKVNAVNPGYCATDLNGHTGYLSAAEGARVVVHLATIGDDGPTGAFLDHDGPLPW